MKIGLLTFYTPDWQPLADVVLPNRQDYCDKHKYKHIIKTGPYTNNNWYYAIDRLQYLYDTLQYFDYLWILNIHALIMNYNTKIEQFIDDEHDFFICEDIHGINAGSFICKNTDWTHTWLKSIIEKAPNINHCWHEQKVMQDEAKLYSNQIKILEHPSINSYYYDLYQEKINTPGHFKKGDFVLHLPGTNIFERMEIFKSDRVKNDLIK